MYENSIVLLDLDDTLYNAVDPWRNLVEKIIEEDFRWKRFPWKTYYAIREHYRVFEFFFEKSFRHYWLSPELIVLLLNIKNNIISSSNLIDNLNFLEFKISMLKTKECRPSNIFRQILSYALSCPEFMKCIQIIEKNKNDNEVIRIEKKFKSEISLNCYPGVLDLLEFLSRNNIRFYLLSEGDYELQLWKMNLLSINHFFEEKILTTEIYKLCPEYLESLSLVKKYLSEKNYNTLLESKEARHADSIIRKYELLKLKDDLFFYYAAFKSIRSDPQKPKAAFLSMDIDDLIDIDEQINDKVIIIGDRVDKDMLPIWKIMGNNSDLIRIRKGKYEIKKRPKGIPGSIYREFNDFYSAYSYMLKIS